MMPNRLLATKLYAPQPRPQLVPRPRLLQKLEAGLASGARLTLVCAPAGYGKSTLLAAWLPAARPFTWLTLDEADNDPVRFLAYLVAALQKMDPSFGVNLLGMLDLPQLPPITALMDELVSDLAGAETPFVLVLDDYHTLHNPQLHDALDYLLDHQPAQLHLALTSRADPPFPLGRLRVRAQLTEIRTHDLRFTPAEAGEFFAQMSLDLPEEALQHLEQTTEGWIAGLQLAALAMQGQEDPQELLEAFGGGHRYVIEYLLDEVLKRQPAEIQAFLRQTSILDRFNAGLCQALVGESCDVIQALADLQRLNLFILPLDATGEWFRYHHLFADVLRLGLSAQAESSLHLRAARWFEAHAFPADAIHHYLASSEPHLAAGLIRQAAVDLLKNGEMYTLLEWIRALPAADVLADADLATFKFMALLWTGNAPQAMEFGQALAEQQKSWGGPANGRWLAVQAYMTFLAGQGAGLASLAQSALDALPPEDAYFRALAWLALATGVMWLGDLPASNAAYQQAIELAQGIGNHFVALAASFCLVYNLVELGDLRHAERLCRQTLEKYKDRRGRLLPLAGVLLIPLASICLDHYQFEEAKSFARQGLDLSNKLFKSQLLGADAEVLLAELAVWEGRPEEAWQWIEQTRSLGRQGKVTFLDYKMDLVEASLRLDLGELPEARQVIATLDQKVQDNLPVARQSLALLRARCLLLEGRSAEALPLVTGVEQEFRLAGNDGKLISVLVLAARVYHALSQEENALAALREVVQRCAPHDLFFTVARHAAGMQPLLRQLRPEAPEYVDRLLSYMPGGAQDAGSPPAASVIAVSGLEPLSDQERNVLRLLAAGCSNQEIAARLFISLGTAKWHVHNLLGKLGARSRAQAIALAREQGLV